MLKIGVRSVFVDLGAEKLIAAERGSEKIAVEIKSFLGPSLINDLETAWGQFFMYARALQRRQDHRVHGCVVHAEIRNDKIWIHYDGIEDGITGELVAAGVPKNHIVLCSTPSIKGSSFNPRASAQVPQVLTCPPLFKTAFSIRSML
ncbi:MAG: hypothetical protein HC769_34890 [Cyanobacteria bacterium CRU_2_1]|nr:hypothetical protein [Cyanobacteria bacterium CRU_2_1]